MNLLSFQTKLSLERLSMEGWNNVENETQIFFMKNKNFIRKINKLWKRELLSLNLLSFAKLLNTLDVQKSPWNEEKKRFLRIRNSSINPSLITSKPFPIFNRIPLHIIWKVMAGISKSPQTHWKGKIYLWILTA